MVFLLKTDRHRGNKKTSYPQGRDPSRFPQAINQRPGKKGRRSEVQEAVMPRFHSHLSLFMNLPLPGAPSTVFPVPAHSHRPGLSERMRGVLFPFLAEFLRYFTIKAGSVSSFSGKLHGFEREAPFGALCRNSRVLAGFTGNLWKDCPKNTGFPILNKSYPIDNDGIGKV